MCIHKSTPQIRAIRSPSCVVRSHHLLCCRPPTAVRTSRTRFSYFCQCYNGPPLSRLSNRDAELNMGGLPDPHFHTYYRSILVLGSTTRIVTRRTYLCWTSFNRLISETSALTRERGPLTMERVCTREFQPVITISINERRVTQWCVSSVTCLPSSTHLRAFGILLVMTSLAVRAV